MSTVSNLSWVLPVILSVHQFSNQPSLRSCALTLKTDLCEKENPVNRKFNLKMFESLEIELAF